MQCNKIPSSTRSGETLDQLNYFLFMKKTPVRDGELQGGSNMTGTDLCVNKPQCAAAVRS